MDVERIFFKSDLFELEDNEEEETNPHIYGKQLASWLHDQLGNTGYIVEEIIPEDWGWYVMCQRDPYWLWVGCSSILESEPEAGKTPKKEDIVWHCFATAEVPFFQRLFKHTNTTDGLSKLKVDLLEIIENENALEIVDEP